MWMKLNGAVDAPRGGPAAGNASRRDRWGKEGGLVNIYIINCYFYSRIPPLPAPVAASYSGTTYQIFVHWATATFNSNVTWD